MRYRPPRFPAHTQTTLSVADQTCSARILNVASSGLKLEGVEAPEIGQKVKLSAMNISVTGEIVWIDGAQSGVELDRALTPNEMAWLRGASIRGSKFAPSSARRHSRHTFREL